MLKVHSEEIGGLCWYVRDFAVLPFWGHGGADPGVNTRSTETARAEATVSFLENALRRLCDELIESSQHEPHGSGRGVTQRFGLGL
jgi:hypothetical protein